MEIEVIRTTKDVGGSFRSKAQMVYEHLRQAIIRGDYAPGHILHQEDLATSLGVSRLPLRQALASLEADGLITRDVHSAARVASLSRTEIEDIYAMREALESALALRAGAPYRSHVGARMHALHAEMERAVERSDFETFVRLDREFHMTLYASAAMSMFSRAMVDRLRNAGDRYVYLYASEGLTARSSIEEHFEIITAYGKSEAQTVHDVTQAHIRVAARDLLTKVKGYGAV